MISQFQTKMVIHGEHSQIGVITDNNILDCQVKYILQGGNPIATDLNILDTDFKKPAVIMAILFCYLECKIPPSK